MKIEKIEKHMRKRTVLVGENAGYPTTVGIVTMIDRDDNTAQVVGYVLPNSRDWNWYGFDRIRKATIEECAAFFAWLRSNGRDVASGFERFGGAPRGWENTPAPTAERAAFGVDTPPHQRKQVVGKRVRCLDRDSDNGRMGTCTHVDDSRLPYRVTFDCGQERYVYTVEVIEGAPAPAPTEPKRLTVGDAAIMVDHREHGRGIARISKIRQDDRDAAPYHAEGGILFFRADHTFPLTLDGFRAANAKQREYGVTYEEGDYVAIYRAADFTFGVVQGDQVLTGHPSGSPLIKGGSDWSDRVVVLTKRPKV